MLKVTTPTGKVSVVTYNEGKAHCLREVATEMKIGKIYQTLESSTETKFLCNGKKWIIPKL